MSDPDIGERLVQGGWRQGVRVPSKGYAILPTLTEENGTAEILQPSEPLEQWIVVSQDCDILSSAEPYVEMMACYWSRRGDSAYTGAKKANSYRYFLVGSQEYEGQRGALIVDATRRAQISKEALIDLQPNASGADDPAFPRLFRQWLGGRYSRPPLPPKVVETIQRPIVDGLKELHKHNRLASEAQGLIREVRIYPLDESPPYDVEMILLIRDDVNDEDERLASFDGWIETLLRKSPETVNSINISPLQAGEMYVSEYESTFKLALDQYSIGASDFGSSGPVQGINHG